MKRRELFKLGAGKAAEITTQMAARKAAGEAEQWLRPPFALDELDFLLACTRCDACIEACPHDVLFKLPARWGLKAVGTPAMDLLNRGCRLCEDWPCVAACEPLALRLPEPDENGDRETPPPAAVKLALVEIDTNTCLPYLGPECGACADSCPVPGALEWHGTKPVINQGACTGCALCREACIADPKAVTVGALAGLSGPPGLSSPPGPERPAG